MVNYISFQKQDNKPVKCTLQSLPEGYLGKMQVLKSGKTRFVLGNVTLDVATGTQCGFLQVRCYEIQVSLFIIIIVRSCL